MANIQIPGAHDMGAAGGNPQLSVGYAPGGVSNPDMLAQRSRDLAEALRSSESAGRAPVGAGAMLANLAAALMARRRIAELTGTGQPDPAAASSDPAVGAGPVVSRGF